MENMPPFYTQEKRGSVTSTESRQRKTSAIINVGRSSVVGMSTSENNYNMTGEDEEKQHNSRINTLGM